jgi:DNA repair protein RadD
MQIQPRSYQVEAVHSIHTYFQTNSGNPVVAMPTATGKSVVIAMFLQMVYHYWPGQRVMVLTHVRELIQQNYDKLKHLWPHAPAGVFSAGLKRKETGHPITFAGIGSVAKRPGIFGHIDLVLIDEAHLVSPSEETTYRKFLDALMVINPQLKVVGFTATPWRLGQGHITEDGLFTDVCFDITGMAAFNRLIAEGYLAPVVPRHTRNMLDVDGVHKRGGEFIPAELQAAVDKLEVTEGALKEVLELAVDRKHWLVFASGVEHALHITDMLNDMGIPAVAVHSNLSNDQRDAALAGFKSGKYRAAVNNNVLTTGFDFPAIDCIVMLRPTSSTVLWVQMLGRGTRIAPGKKNTLVLDFAGNTRRLGPINDPLIPRKKGDGPPGEAPVKLCGSCGVYNHTSARVCCMCGAEFTFQTKISIHAAENALLKGEAPVTAVFVVDHITYAEHEKQGRPPMVKVTYYCVLRNFTEYVCFEHDGFAGRKARAWWKDRSWDNFPGSTEEALLVIDTVKPATHLRVWVNKEYPEILAHCFDGTAFGTQAPVATPKSSVRVPVSAQDLEDDIPF